MLTQHTQLDDNYQTCINHDDDLQSRTNIIKNCVKMMLSLLVFAIFVICIVLFIIHCGQNNGNCYTFGINSPSLTYIYVLIIVHAYFMACCFLIMKLLYQYYISKKKEILQKDQQHIEDTNSYYGERNQRLKIENIYNNV